MKTFTVITQDANPIVFDTEVTTFGGLKDEFRNHNIDITDKAIYEGLTKIEISKMDDEGILPHDVMYKGNRTDNLVFMITPAKKNFNSGMNGQEIFVEIKKRGLEKKVKEVYGKNYTLVSNDNLLKLIVENDCPQRPNIIPNIHFKEIDINELMNKAPKIKDIVNISVFVSALIEGIVKICAEYGLLDTLEEILKKETDNDENTSTSNYSEEELNEMFENI